MILLEDKENVTAPDATWPFGDVKDDTGSDDGTRLNKNNLSDIHQFFAKMFDESGLTANGLLDNETNGWQLYEALLRAGKRYNVYTALINQTGTSAPTAEILENDLNADSDPIVWTRNSAGVYTGTLAGIFTEDKTWFGGLSIGGTITTNANKFQLVRASDDAVTLISRNDSDATADSILVDTPIEIRVYRS